MSNEVIGLVWTAVVGIFTIVVVHFVRKHIAAIRDVLGRVVSAAGWSEVRSTFLGAAGVKGMWQSFPVRLRYHQRQKSIPERLVLTVRAQTDARLIVRRKLPGLFSNRRWFGPPVIEMRQREAADLWVQGDQPTLAERLFSDAEMVQKIVANLLASQDEIRIDNRGLKITRALDEVPPRIRFGLGLRGFKFDANRYETIAREELALVEALVKRLSVLP